MLCIAIYRKDGAFSLQYSQFFAIFGDYLILVKNPVTTFCLIAKFDAFQIYQLHSIVVYRARSVINNISQSSQNYFLCQHSMGVGWTPKIWTFGTSDTTYEIY